MNVENDALRVLYERILDLARQAFSFAQAAQSRVADSCDDGADHAAEQQREPVIANELSHKPVQERSSANQTRARVAQDGCLDTMREIGIAGLDDRELLANA